MHPFAKKVILSGVFLCRQFAFIRSLHIMDSALLACQRNSYLKESTNRVLLCEKKPDADLFRVILDDSVLYPEGGGQPFDLGTVNGFSVSKVVKPSQDLSPRLQELGVNEETLNKCVEIELSGPVDTDSMVNCIVDWNRRYDFMQQHTAQVSGIYSIIVTQ